MITTSSACQHRMAGALWAVRSSAERPMPLSRALLLAAGITVSLAIVMVSLPRRPVDEGVVPIMRATLVPPDRAAAPVAPTPPRPIRRQPEKVSASNQHSYPIAPPVRPSDQAPPVPHTPDPGVTSPQASDTPSKPLGPPPPPAPLPPTPKDVSAPTMAQDIGIICPVQPKPQMPQRAIDEDIGGIVHARALIRDGTVKEVVLLDGPRVFYAAVKAAMLKYQCQAGPVGGVWAEQTFDFKEAEGN